MSELAISLEEKTIVEELLEEIVSFAIDMGVEIKAKKEKVKEKKDIPNGSISCKIFAVDLTNVGGDIYSAVFL